MSIDTDNALWLTRARAFPPTLQPLEPLSRNFWWSWAPDGEEVFRDLDPGLWQQCEQNPRALLAQVSDLQLTQMAADPAYADRIRKLFARFRDYMTDKRAWAKLQMARRISQQTP